MTAAIEMDGRDGNKASLPQALLLAGIGVSSAGTGLVLPLTALYLTGILQAGSGAVGLYFALTAGSAFLANPFAGRIADRRSPVPVIFGALLFQAAGAIVLSLSGNLGQASVAAVLAGIGNGSYYAVLMPTVKLIFGQSALGRFFSRNFMIANVAVAVAAAASGVVVASWGERGYRLCFAANALSFVLLGVALAAQLKRTPPAEIGSDVRVRPLAPWRPYLDARFVALPLTQMCIIGFGVVQLEAIMPLVLHDYGGYSTRIVSVFLAANGLAVFALQTLTEKYVERIGEIGALQRAVIVWIVSLPLLYLGFVFAGPIGVAVVILYAVIFGLAETLVSPSMQPLAAKSAPEGNLGTYAAAVSMAYSIGTAIGPAIGAAVLTAGGVAGYLTLLAVVLLVPLPLLARHRRVMRRPEVSGAGA
ncbi:MFS transporter [Micromonospora sp. B11E3]|uniref:MFS transporter n=1 Tax=Micromonospora sp. B11E3 TaxID=3153562 RepID=UPI00325DB148